MAWGCIVVPFEEYTYGSCETQEELKARKEKAKLKLRYPNQPELWGDEAAEELKKQIQEAEDDLLNDLPF